MLKQLAESMDQKGIKAVGLIMTKEGDNITVVISPVKISGEALPNLKVTNTPEGLEQELPELLERHKAVVGNNLQDLEKEADKKPEKKADKKSTSSPKKPAKKTEPKPEEDKLQTTEQPGLL